jgi:hypothetical protein
LADQIERRRVVVDVEDSDGVLTWGVRHDYANWRLVTDMYSANPGHTAAEFTVGRTLHGV